MEEKFAGGRIYFRHCLLSAVPYQHHCWNTRRFDCCMVWRTKEGNKDVCIWTSHYQNGKWTAPAKCVADGWTTAPLCLLQSCFILYPQETVLFYKINNVAGWTGWMKRSTDNGKTWSAREKLPDGLIKNKPVLINGVLFCPSSTEKKQDGKRILNIPAIGAVTWTKAPTLNDNKNRIEADTTQHPAI